MSVSTVTIDRFVIVTFPDECLSSRLAPRLPINVTLFIPNILLAYFEFID